MNHRAADDQATAAVSASSPAAPTTPAKRRARRPSAPRRPPRTAVDYVAAMDLPQLVREPLGELATRFDERSFLPTIGDVRNFLLFCDYEGPTPKARGAAAPRVFKLLARMDPARVATIRDERMFSGPAQMLPIANAIGQASSGVQPTSIEIHVEMFLAPAGSLQVLRQLLIDRATEPWAHAQERSSQVGARARQEALVFRRWPDDDIPESEVVLHARDAGYRLSNIVPVLQGDRRDIAAWNTVLEDFTNRVVAPAIDATRHKLTLGPRRVAIRDLVSLTGERTLRRFSGAANRSAGSAHPLDELRWMEFVIACAEAHGRQGRPPLTPTLDGGLLRRWLTEVDGWNSEVADGLVQRYEFGLSLIQLYDQKR